MIGKHSWNVGLASAGMILIFLINISNNVLTTSLLRSLYSFACLFVIVFAVRFLLGFIGIHEAGDQQEDEVKGQHIDIVTPDDEASILGQQSASAEEDFSPLNPPKVNADQVDPDLVVKAVRQLTQE